MARWRTNRGASANFKFTGAGSPPTKPKGSGFYKPFDGGAKDACYRTNDINNALYRDRKGKERIKVVEGDINATDLKTITMNFHSRVTSPIVEDRGMWNDKYAYTLECGHRTAVDKPHSMGARLHCKKCTAEQTLLSFEHEWTHIYFKSDLVLRTLFVDRLVDDLRKQYPQVPWDAVGDGLKPFLHLTVNAFDDLRVNSLQEKVRPGSASRIWDKWRRTLTEKSSVVEESFPHYVMATHLGVQLDPNGPFAALQPVLAYATNAVRYKGSANMMSIVRWALDRCMGTLLSQIVAPPQAPQPQQGGQSGQPQANQTPAPQGGEAEKEEELEAREGQAGGEDQQGDSSGSAPSEGAGVPGTGQGDPGQGGEIRPPDSPSGAQLGQTLGQAPVLQALTRLTTGSTVVDPEESHPVATPQDLQDAKNGEYSKFMIAALAKAFDDKTLDTKQLEKDIDPNTPDPDMDDALQQLQQASMSGLTRTSVLTGNAKANLVLIDVQPKDVSHGFSLTPEQDEMVARLRSHFYKVLGRQKSKRDEVGSSVDLEGYVQHLIESGKLTGNLGTPTTLDVFEEDRVSRGFYALGLVDMSGSMGNCFHLVGQAWEILKASLDFPFVETDLYGFRGGESVHGHTASPGEVWIYRYHRRCHGYIGSSRVRGYGAPFQAPVDLGGITPMNSAIHVAVQTCLRQPVGMVKRLFVLTDGSPIQDKLSGKSLSPWLLRKFVRKEVMDGRSKGVGVMGVIVGDDISDAEAVEMFGPPQFWKRASKPPDVSRTLQVLVLNNFSRYLKGRS